MATDAFGRRPDPDRTGPRPFLIPGWIVTLALAVLSLGGTAFVLVREERHKVDDPIEQARRGAITNLHRNSMLRAQRLQRAYALAARGLRPTDVVTQLTVTPTALELYVRDADAYQRVRSVDAAFAVRTQDAGRSESLGLRPGAVRVAGVEPIVRRVLARVRDPQAKVATLRMSLVPGDDGIVTQSEWHVVVDGVRPRDSSWYGRVDGGAVRRSDEPADLTQTPTTAGAPAVAPTRPAEPVTVDGRPVHVTGARKRRLERCFRRASEHPERLQACVEAAL